MESCILNNEENTKNTNEETKDENNNTDQSNTRYHVMKHFKMLRVLRKITSITFFTIPVILWFVPT